MSQFQVWQEGYHPEAIFNADFARQKIDYIHDNPLRAGLVAAPEVSVTYMVGYKSSLFFQYCAQSGSILARIFLPKVGHENSSIAYVIDTSDILTSPALLEFALNQCHAVCTKKFL